MSSLCVAGNPAVSLIIVDGMTNLIELANSKECRLAEEIFAGNAFAAI